MKSHIHAELMKQYAEDAAKSETPWENWEYTLKDIDKWFNLEYHPTWDESCEYRRKPKRKFIELNGKKFEIFAEKPEHGEEYWCVAIPDFVVYNYTFNSGFDTNNFLTNNCFKDEMTAKDFAKELKKIFNNVVES